VAAVGMSGFLVYTSLSQIVNSIHKEALPDYRLIVFKNITLDLLEIENSIELYTHTKDKSHLKHFDTVNKRLKNRVSLLEGLSNEEGLMLHWNDSIKNLVETKLTIWEEIKQIRTIKDYPEQQFEELYSMLEKKEVDTVKVEIMVPPTPKKGFLKKIFGKKDTATIRVDTTYIEKTVENEEIRAEIEQLETDLKKREQKSNKRELELIEQNILVTGKLNQLIAQFEEVERDNLIVKTNEADRLASETYSRLLAFTILAVVLLFVVIYVVFRNVRKERAYHRVLKKATSEAESLARTKEGFMATVSHEMRTPVNAIYGMTEQLLQDKTSVKVKEKLSILLASSKHLKSIVNDILDFSKIHANKLQLEEIDFSPKDLIHEIIELHKPDAASRAIVLKSQIENKIPIAIMGDPLRLRQILINIIGNAIKFTEEGSVTLLVKSKANKDKQCDLYFQVIDTGIGISEENLEHVFEEFVQVESDFTRSFSGTGLGLSIVKNLIELQSGSVSIKSKLGEGTNVSFNIPYKIGNSKKVQKPKPEELFVPEKILKQNILVVDDEEFNRYLLKVIFEKWGVKYQVAKNGEEAVTVALENDFDIILMDIRMPKLNGIEATKLIHKEKPNISVVAIAAANGESEMKLCYEAGMKEFLKKPFSELDLLNTLISVLDFDKQELNTEYFDEFDLEELERLTAGDKEFMKEMIQIFIRSAKTGLENINAALKEENWAEIREAAHKMAAPCNHIGAKDLYTQIKQLEKITKEQASLQLVPDLVISINKNVKSINKTLSGLIDSETFNPQFIS
jgi:signal transduction histidine kinase/DNA-binding response OmpR family regulator